MKTLKDTLIGVTYLIVGFYVYMVVAGVVFVIGHKIMGVFL